MEVLEGREDLDDVGQRLVDRQRVVAARLAHALLEDRFERRAPDVFHDDVARAVEGHEIVDLDDVRVFDLGEEALFGNRRGQGVRVAGIEQALEDDPAVGDVAVLGEVDPPEAAVGETPGDLVLPGDEVTLLELGIKREGLATLGAEPGRATRLVAR